MRLKKKYLLKVFFEEIGHSDPLCHRVQQGDPPFQPSRVFLGMMAMMEASYSIRGNKVLGQLEQQCPSKTNSAMWLWKMFLKIQP